MQLPRQDRNSGRHCANDIFKSVFLLMTRQPWFRWWLWVARVTHHLNHRWHSSLIHICVTRSSLVAHMYLLKKSDQRCRLHYCITNSDSRVAWQMTNGDIKACRSHRNSLKGQHYDLIPNGLPVWYSITMLYIKFTLVGDCVYQGLGIRSKYRTRTRTEFIQHQ